MFFTTVLILSLYVSYSTEFTLSENGSSLIEHAQDSEDYFNAMREDYGNDFASVFKELNKGILNRRKRSGHKCELESLFQKNEECLCKSGPHKTMVELEMINGDMSGNTLQMPRCIAIERCNSACSMPTHKCVAIEKEIVKIPVGIIKQATFPVEQCAIQEVVKHLKCTCACNMTEKSCTKYQKYDAENCKCRCKLTPQMCGKEKKPNHDSCKCECRHRRHCSSGSEFDTNVCKCVELNNGINYGDY